MVVYKFLLVLFFACSATDGFFRRSFVLHSKQRLMRSTLRNTVAIDSPIDTIPLHTFTAKSPLVGRIQSVKSAVGPKAKGEVYHIVIDHGGKLPYLEGQCLGVIPPGINEKTGKAHINRLYSIASTRYGDDLKGMTATLCVRRLLDLESEEPSFTGLCSNFLCTSKPGDEVLLTGPTGKLMLLPSTESPQVDIIMIATGTGIAPFRAFLRRLFVEDHTPNKMEYNGLAWLIAGVANNDSLLYDEEFQSILKKQDINNFRLRLDYALSREQVNKKGGKMYVQDKVEENVMELYERMERGAHIYFCGLRAMMSSILSVLEAECNRRQVNWIEKQREWKNKGQWHVEVY